MDNIIFSIGLLGASLLVLGAAWKQPKEGTPNYKVIKGWLFFLGGITMIVFSGINYYLGKDSIFFLFLQLFATIASGLGLSTINTKINTILVGIFGTIFVFWSLTLIENMNTLIFILGLIGIAIGYVQPFRTVRKNAFLFSGGALITIFSFIVSSWIFFGLNLFFALFSAYYMLSDMQIKK